MAAFAFLLAACGPARTQAQDEREFRRQREQLAEALASDRYTGAMPVRHPRVLEAMRRVERHRFVPPEMLPHAYEDRPLPIGMGQTISQPYIVAKMTELIDPRKADRVLEVGTGSGYQAAVLAELVAQVYTIEIVAELGRQAERRLAELGYRNVQVRIGDGWAGWPEEAPFDKIIVTAAPPEIPLALVEQLRPGGRMIVPVGARYQTQELVLVTKGTKGPHDYTRRNVMPVIFVPMIQEAEKP